MHETTDAEGGLQCSVFSVQKNAEDLGAAAKMDVLVDDGIQLGLPLEAIVLAMAERNRDSLARIRALLAIAPRKVLYNGNWVIWRCPDDLVPKMGD